MYIDNELIINAINDIEQIRVNGQIYDIEAHEADMVNNDGRMYTNTVLVILSDQDYNRIKSLNFKFLDIFLVSYEDGYPSQYIDGYKTTEAFMMDFILNISNYIIKNIQS